MTTPTPSDAASRLAIDEVFQRWLHGDTPDERLLPGMILDAICDGKVPGVRLVPAVGPDPRDQWYPGNDGVATVDELWAYYCERGDAINALRADLAKARGEVEEARSANVDCLAREARAVEHSSDMESRFWTQRAAAMRAEDKRDAAVTRAEKAQKERDALAALLAKIRKHSSKVEVDGDFYAAFNRRYLDEIDAVLTPKDGEVVERLAALEHEQWMAWAGTIAEKEPISDERRARWMSCMVPYAQLSEEMKEHDRVWARKVLSVFSAHLAPKEAAS